MKNTFKITIVLCCAAILPLHAQVTGLNNVKIFLDPGHSQKENQGLYGYSEAEKTLQVALAIKNYLLTTTDLPAANLKLCRENNNDNVSLTQRTDMANAWNADFYYSIHSDAGAVTSNSTLTMYGGWKVNGVVIEKTPNGGKAFGDILNPNLNGVMRLSTRGNVADRTYYDGAQTHANHYPYLHVNRESNMPSLLSEAGFHTNPTQQSRNLNAEWKKLEALAAFQSLVKHFGATPPVPGVATGFITDSETNIPVNGAKITVTDGITSKEYTTDSYTSLFYNYSKKPDELHNGFYFLEGLTPGATATVAVEAENYRIEQKQLTIPAALGATTQNGLAVLDVALLNLAPAVVTGVEPENLAAVPVERPLVITFSRKMNRASVESAISIAPAAGLTFTWPNDYTLNINISSLNFETDYTLTIDALIAKNSLTDDFLDGNKDGTAGGNYVLPFTTGEQDTTPPSVVSYDPATTVEEARPIVRIEFSEPLNETTIAPNQVTVTDSNGETVGGTQRYATVNGKSVIHYFFSTDLEASATYVVKMNGGVEDLYGNALATPLEYSFTTRPREITLVTLIDDFEANTSGWPTDPKANSGTTVNVNEETTRVGPFQQQTASLESIGSMILDYQWTDAGGGANTIRFTKNSATPKFKKASENTIQVYVFGDGSHSTLRLTVRPGTSGTIWSCTPILVNWVGWKLISWNPSLSGEAWLTGTTIDDGTDVNFACIGLHGAPSGEIVYTPSYLLFDDLKVVTVGNYVTAIGEVSTGAPEINVSVTRDFITVSSNEPVKEVKIYSMTGALVKAAKPGIVACQLETSGLPEGIYVVKVTTATARKIIKIKR
jgi:N-acetylmuramoyl-L-alanine amidase